MNNTGDDAHHLCSAESPTLISYYAASFGQSSSKHAQVTRGEEGENEPEEGSRTATKLVYPDREVRRPVARGDRVRERMMTHGTWVL
jgi:hypothetical protein